MIRPVELGNAPRSATQAQAPSCTTPGSSFDDVLKAELNVNGDVRFSAHAQRRMNSRGVSLTPNDQARITRAVDTAAAKGSRESLLLMERVALVVNVPNRTVVTVVPHGEAKDSVFTNIDSAVVVAQDAP